MKKLTILVLFLVALASVAHAGNYVQTGDRVVLEYATTSPTVGDAVLKCGSKALGGLCGVAMNGVASTGEKIVVSLEGVFNLPVTASSTVGNMAIGDYVYGSVGGIEVSTTVLSNINTGLCFGQILDAITASTTAAVYNTVRVRVQQPGHL